MFALLLTPALAHSQAAAPVSRVCLALGGGFLTSGAYFTGPGDLRFANGDAFAPSLQLSVGVHRALAVVLAVAHARPEWRLTGIPLIGSAGLPGARLWFGDAALRGELPLGGPSGVPVVFAQAGGGIAHYALSTSLLGNEVNEHATNLALALGAGLALPVAGRLSAEVMAKDYIASFKSVQDFVSLGIEGRRAHTLLVLVSARIAL